MSAAGASQGRILLQAESLACGFSDVPLIKELELTIREGEAVAIIGPNGAGKTTLLRTLAGQLPSLAGQALLQDTAAADLDPLQRARRVAVLTQQDQGDNALTVRELVELGRTPHLGLWGHLQARDHQMVDEALEACQLTALAGRPLGRISGGERQRARIALTLAQEAPLLLLDEPVNHLDLKRRYAFFDLVGRLRQERRLAVVLVLHDPADAFRESDKVLVLTKGRAEHVLPQAPDRIQRLAHAFDVPEERISL